MTLAESIPLVTLDGSNSTDKWLTFYEEDDVIKPSRFRGPDSSVYVLASSSG